MKIIEFFYKIICAFCNYIWWPIWSNIRWKKESKIVIEFDPNDKISKFDDIGLLCRRLYSNYEWTKDGIDQLFDSICPPQYNYFRYKTGKLKDDCDGFHALVYYCLKQSGVNCYLLSVCSLGSGHCVLLFEYDDGWYVVDYYSVMSPSFTAADAIKKYNKVFSEKYHARPVIFNALLSYNFDKNKFSAHKTTKIN